MPCFKSCSRGHPCFAYFLPLFLLTHCSAGHYRWVQKHAGSIDSMEILTEGCNASCTMDSCCTAEPGVCQYTMSKVLAMLMASLQGHSIPVTVKLDRKPRPGFAV